MNIEQKSHRNRAVVVGGSMAGLLAARVLSDFYENVIVLERDDLSDEGQNRRGVPHGRHAHALLAGGQRVLERFFPGISDDMYAAGGVPADPLQDGTWFFEGGALSKTPSGSTGVLATRPLIESAVRRRVRELDRVEIRDNQSVRDLIASDGGKRVTGVLTEDGPVMADLVVDASGRGSRSGAWLKSLGFERAPEEKVEVELVYTTRMFRLRPGRLADDKFVVCAPTPEGKRGGVIGMQEGDRWIATLFGHFGHRAPGDLEGYIEFARSLPMPVIYNAIRDAEPLGEAVDFRFPASTRRRYEKLGRFPEGFVVFGDAICSFNPIYGQGMSVASLQAKTLHETLRSGDASIARRFFKSASKVIDNPWNIAVGADLKMPETTGPRGVGVNVINWYIGNVHKQAHTDRAASHAFGLVAQLLESPNTLLRPGMVMRVLFGILRRKLRAGEKRTERLLTTAEPQRASGDGF